MKSHPSNPEANDLSRQGSREIDNEVISYPFGDIENYELCYRIGRGKYSTVFSGLTNTGQQCVLKVLKPVRASKINREIRILEKLKESPNICNLLDVVKDQESQMVTLVLDWTNDDFRNIYQTLEMNDIAYYMYKVLQALDFAHSRGIMHRDIKPQNIMIDHSTKKVSLIDWGLADFYIPGTSYQVRVATRNYKAPELLFGYAQYTPTVDIWGLGCTLAAMLTKKSPLFRGRDNAELILRIADFVGSEEIENYLQKYKITISSHDIASRISGHKRRAHEFLKKDDTKNFITPMAEDLLMKMLTVDHQERISAKDAMSHPFFDCVRDMFK